MSTNSTENNIIVSLENNEMAQDKLDINLTAEIREHLKNEFPKETQELFKMTTESLNKLHTLVDESKESKNYAKITELLRKELIEDHID